jgi:hypothetical protein
MSARPACTMDGKVQKIIKSPDPRIPDKAEIGRHRTATHDLRGAVGRLGVALIVPVQLGEHRVVYVRA